MSCERSPNRLARLAQAGIAVLTSKRGFYAGVAAGTAGLLGAGLVAFTRRRNSPSARAKQPGQMTLPASPVVPVLKRKFVPQLRPRLKVEPVARVLPSEQCVGCRTPGGSKPGAWYFVNGKTYCPDCAPQAANRAGVDLIAPVSAEPHMAMAGGQKGATVVSTAGTALVQPEPLSPERKVVTHLMASRIGLRLGQAANGPLAVPVNGGYVVLRPDGTDTGLAVTPALKIEEQNGVAVTREDTSRWWITHIPSGKSLPGAGPYRSPEEAHLLAAVLAQLDWTRDETDITTADHRRAGATISLFNQSLAEAQKQAAAGEPTAPPTHRPPRHESLVGKLMADGKGGVSRVLEDRGDRLFMIDSLGERYEIGRNEIRTPDESDFEMCRVAMAFDPTNYPETKCARCGRLAGQSSAEEKWYKMNRQTFCIVCAAHYATEEGYAREEEIGDELELSR